MLELNSVTKKFRGKIVLNQVSLHLESGVYGMLGPNGAGKTTLIRCLLGLYPISGGNIQTDIPHHQIGYLPQNFSLFSELTVYDMLYYFCGLKKIPKNQRNDAIEAALASVNLSEHKKSKISKLSGGMQRRVGIAQAIIGNPPVIIFDEPTVGLDPDERKRFRDILFALKTNRIILLSTHIVGDLEEVSDQIIIMNHGQIIKTGTLQELCEMNDDKHFLETAYLNIISENNAGEPT